MTMFEVMGLVSRKKTATGPQQGPGAMRKLTTKAFDALFGSKKPTKTPTLNKTNKAER